MNKKINAFTIAELIVVLSVISVIAAITITSFINNNSLDEKRIIALSRKFDTSIENTYQEIVYSHTRNSNIQTFLNKDGDYGTSKDLKDYFVKYLDGQNISKPDSTPTEEDDSDADVSDNENESNCDELIIAKDSPVASYKSGAQCAMFSPNIIAGFVLDTTCSLTLTAKNYLQKSKDNPEDEKSREVTNACGYVIYGFERGQGEFTKDLFVIPLGKTHVK